MVENIEAAYFIPSSEEIYIGEDNQRKIAQYLEKREANGDYNYYAKKRNTTPELAKHNDRVGKIGEFIASIFLGKVGESYTPDCNVYPFGQKSFAPDLGGNQHVKSADRKFDGHPSWTFQLQNDNGVGGTDDILTKSPKELMEQLGVFVYVSDVDKGKGEVLMVARMDFVKNSLRNPILEKYIGRKKCLYFSDFANK